MKVAEVIAMVDGLRPNGYDADIKAKWLSEVDGMIVDEIINLAEGNEIEFGKYEYAEDAEKETVLPDRFTDIYEHYIKSKIEFYDDETVNYNNEVAAFQASYSQYAAWYRRNHMPKQPAKIRI